MRPNALIPSPPTPEHGRKHALGSMTEERIRSVFGNLGEACDDPHRGVFISTLPLVAYVYGYERKRTDYNDFGELDVVDPPVLIGLRVPSEDLHYDTDVMVKALDLLNESTELLEDYDPEDEFFIEEVEFEEGDYRTEYVDFGDQSLATYGGIVGNEASLSDFKVQLIRVLDELRRKGVEPRTEPDEMDDDVKFFALDAATELLPQARVVRDVTEAEVVSILVVPHFRADPWSDEEDEMPYRDPAVELQPHGEMSELLPVMNDFILSESYPVYLKPGHTRYDADVYHGTSLSIARKAFPELITSEKMFAGIEAGSAHDLRAMQEEYDELEYVTP